jgi:hypothetical protein
MHLSIASHWHICISVAAGTTAVTNMIGFCGNALYRLLQLDRQSPWPPLMPNTAQAIWLTVSKDISLQIITHTCILIIILLRFDITLTATSYLHIHHSLLRFDVTLTATKPDWLSYQLLIHLGETGTAGRIPRTLS